ncbi:MAG: DUF507 family protein [Thermodesulfovibrionales bacterium]|nr:DUF507 family protein [Thermodesulfovibrionales bacterium]
MMLSDDKIRHLTHLICKGLVDKNALSPLEGEEKLRREIKRTIIEELRIGEDIDITVRKKIDSLSKRPVEGSMEWEVLYKKYFSEEETRRGRK